MDNSSVNHWQQPDLLKVELSLLYDVSPAKLHENLDLLHQRLGPRIVVRRIAVLKNAAVSSYSRSGVHLRMPFGTKFTVV